MDLFKAPFQRKVAIDLNTEVDVEGRGECNTHQIVARI